MGTLASWVGSERPKPPPVRPSQYEAITRSTSLSPSMAMAKYGPLSRRHGQPITRASPAAAAPAARDAAGHGQPSRTMRMLAL
jgi:hypothetical protein